MEIQKIYFDLDGVLADFDAGLRTLCGIEPLSVNAPRTPEYEDAMRAAIRAVPHFYFKLELIPGSGEMFRRIHAEYGSACEILTGIPKPKRGIVTAAEDKTAWARERLSPDIPVNIVLREEKPRFCAGKGCLLVDDTQANVDAWEAMGGTGILHVNPEATLSALQSLRAR